MDNPTVQRDQDAAVAVLEELLSELDPDLPDSELPDSDLLDSDLPDSLELESPFELFSEEAVDADSAVLVELFEERESFR